MKTDNIFLIIIIIIFEYILCANEFKIVAHCLFIYCVARVLHALRKKYFSNLFIHFAIGYHSVFSTVTSNFVKYLEPLQTGDVFIRSQAVLCGDFPMCGHHRMSENQMLYQQFLNVKHKRIFD